MQIRLCAGAGRPPGARKKHPCGEDGQRLPQAHRPEAPVAGIVPEKSGAVGGADEHALAGGTKEAYEGLQGYWLIELGELAAMRKIEIETIKNFISKQVDSYRAAYGRRGLLQSVVRQLRRQNQGLPDLVHGDSLGPQLVNDGLGQVAPYGFNRGVPGPALAGGLGEEGQGRPAALAL